jgi:hypothetical protein
LELRIAWQVALWSILLSFVLSTAIAWIYVITHQGISYSRAYVQTIALSGIVSSVVMLAIGNDVARGLGLVGALTVVRFRTNLKDTRDLIFVFASLGIGVSCGVQSFAVALLGAGVFCLAAMQLAWAGFGSRRQFDAVLRLQLPGDQAAEQACLAVMRRHLRAYVLVHLREAGAGGGLQEHAYQVKFSDPRHKGQFVNELNGIAGLTGVTLLMQDTSLEM